MMALIFFGVTVAALARHDRIAPLTSTGNSVYDLS
jgi:hypothetical protein